MQRCLGDAAHNYMDPEGNFHGSAIGGYFVNWGDPALPPPSKNNAGASTAAAEKEFRHIITTVASFTILASQPAS